MVIDMAIAASGFTPIEYADLAQTYIDDIPRLLSQLREAPPGDTSAQLRKLHEVTNSLRLVGADGAASVVAALEERIREGEAVPADRVMRIAGDAIWSIGRQLHAWLVASGFGPSGAH